LVIVLVFNIVLNNNILSFDGFNNLFIEFTPIVLAVMAQTMALLVREMDLSVGSMISLSTVVMSTTMGHFGYFSILIVLVMAVVIGFINGWIVAYIKAPGIVVTLAVSMILSGIALVILPNPGGVIPESFSNLLMDNYIFLPNSMFLVLIVLLIWKFIKRSRIGQSLYATGANYYSAYATGIKVKRYKIFGYIGSSVLASLAAMMLCAKTMTGDALIGNSFTLTSISGAILGGVSFFGGIGKMKGAVAGAMVIAILVNILQFLNVSSFYQYMVEGAILILAVTLSIPKIKIKVEN
jgi:ribose transport system permease protein